MAAFLLGGAFWLDQKGLAPSWKKAPVLGNVTRAFGTVKNGVGNRLETGRSILVPFHLGDQIQTGEESAAELLFHGGSILQLESGTIVRFEEDGDQVSIRMMMGRAYFEFQTGQRFAFRKRDGTVAEVPEGKRLVLTLSAVEDMDQAVEVQMLDSDQSFDSLADIELQYLARGNEVANLRPLIVRPIEDMDRLPAEFDARDLKLRPRIRGPKNEAGVDLNREEEQFEWTKVSGSVDDPVIGYEIVIRPAFNYSVEDRARQERVFKSKDPELSLEKVGGEGTFLWSVRAVTASGKRGPAWAAHWLEVKFPKQLLAPELMKPKVE